MIYKILMIWLDLNLAFVAWKLGFARKTPRGKLLPPQSLTPLADPTDHGGSRWKPDT
jgi:hypothetical protein